MGAARFPDLRAFSPGRPFGLAMVAVVGSFTASLALSHYAARTIDRNVAGITSDAAPSIMYLMRARTDLSHLVTYPGLYVAWQSEGAQASRAGIEAGRRRLAAEWTAYVALPAFPGEAELARQTAADLAPLMTIVDRVLAKIDHGDVAGARSVWQSDMLPAVERVDAGFERLIERNTLYARARAEEIATVRHRAAMTALALGALSLLLAAGATGLAIATLRRHQRLVAQRNLLAHQRADELEQFASRVAHDIKSPLGAVGLALQVARRSVSEDRARAVTTRALSSLQRVQQIVDGLLEFAKAGARPDAAVATPLADAVADVIDELRPLAEERQVAISVARADTVFVACAPGALASVVSNLVRNAIKFAGEQRQRRVEVRLAQRGRVARLEVEDNGLGVAPELQQLIFEPYVRAAGPSEPGIGLGLATVKRLVEAHGGAVGVQSRPGQGSCFWVELPVVDAPDAAHAHDTGTPAPAPVG